MDEIKQPKNISYPIRIEIVPEFEKINNLKIIFFEFHKDNSIKIIYFF